MPETLFRVRWPDDSHETCYSPSSIIATYLGTDQTYTVEAFVAACQSGLAAASKRVAQVYGGHGCSRARAQLAAIEAKAGRFDETATVRVEEIGGRLRRSA